MSCHPRQPINLCHDSSPLWQLHLIQHCHHWQGRLTYLNRGTVAQVLDIGPGPFRIIVQSIEVGDVSLRESASAQAKTMTILRLSLLQLAKFSEGLLGVIHKHLKTIVSFFRQVGGIVSAHTLAMCRQRSPLLSMPLDDKPGHTRRHLATLSLLLHGFGGQHLAVSMPSSNTIRSFSLQASQGIFSTTNPAIQRILPELWNCLLHHSARSEPLLPILRVFTDDGRCHTVALLHTSCTPWSFSQQSNSSRKLGHWVAQ